MHLILTPGTVEPPRRRAVLDSNNLYIVDKMAGLNVSFVQRVHCNPSIIPTNLTPLNLNTM